MIVFDFITLKNQNIGRARTRGAEIVLRQTISSALDWNAGYTYLDGKDLDTGSSLLRRPRHRAYLETPFRPVAALTISPRVTFVGRRADVDALSFTRIEDPSYFRYDLFVRYGLASLSPYARLENVTDHRYGEVNGYPAPRRRFTAGLEARF